MTYSLKLFSILIFNVKRNNEDSILMNNCVNFIVIKTSENLRFYLLALLLNNHQANSGENDEHFAVSLFIKEKNKLASGTDRTSKHASKSSVINLDVIPPLFSIPNENNNAFRLKDQCLYIGVYK